MKENYDRVIIMDDIYGLNVRAPRLYEKYCPVIRAKYFSFKLIELIYEED